MITKNQIDIEQGWTENEHPFGYVAGDDGGYFFTWMPTLEGTLNSVEVDDIDGDGGLQEYAVREFLREYLPTTAMGRDTWE